MGLPISKGKALKTRLASTNFLFFSRCWLLIDDLEVTDINDRKILLSETAKLSSSKSNESQLSTTTKTHFAVHNEVLPTPVITVSDFGDNEEKLDHEKQTNKQGTGRNKELLNHKVINLSYAGDESNTEDGSERDCSFKDSDEEHDFGKLS